MTRFDYLPQTRAVAAWFGMYGRTLDDVTSYRRQIEVVTTECRKASADALALRSVQLLPEAQAIEESVRQAKGLVDRMEVRLMQLGVQPDPVAARMVSDVAVLLEQFGDAILEDVL